MRRRKATNQVSTAHLEQAVAHYRALGNDDAAKAIASLAYSISAPICGERIAEEAERRRKFYNRGGVRR